MRIPGWSRLPAPQRYDARFDGPAIAARAAGVLVVLKADAAADDVFGSFGFAVDRQVAGKLFVICSSCHDGTMARGSPSFAGLHFAE